LQVLKLLAEHPCIHTVCLQALEEIDVLLMCQGIAWEALNVKTLHLVSCKALCSMGTSGELSERFLVGYRMLLLGAEFDEGFFLHLHIRASLRNSNMIFVLIEKPALSIPCSKQKTHGASD
jgi:hypothetical protein